MVEKVNGLTFPCMCDDELGIVLHFRQPSRIEGANHIGLNKRISHTFMEHFRGNLRELIEREATDQGLELCLCPLPQIKT